jgi:hypothetical protein
MQLKETILSLNDQIVTVRNSNALLLNQSREFIAKTMVSLSKINSPEHTYANGGDSHERSASVVVDRRV